LVVLNIIPRLAQLTISREYLQSYEAAVITGALSFTWIDMFNIHLQLGWLGILMIGIFSGSFVGMLAAALTEVINVIPILAKRLGLDAYVLWLLMAMILGKVAGSLFEWFLM
jgi:stage V sporulation protein AB